jgi:hypothetical protein
MIKIETLAIKKNKIRTSGFKKIPHCFYLTHFANTTHEAAKKFQLFIFLFNFFFFAKIKPKSFSNYIRNFLFSFFVVVFCFYIFLSYMGIGS